MPSVSGVVTLAQAVDLATKNNRDYKREKESLYLTALSLTDERHRYARQWFATIDADYLRENQQFDFTLDETGDEDAGFDQTFLFEDGTIIASTVALDLARFLNGDPRMTLRSVLDVSATVPILGSGGGKIEWENLTQAERNVLYEIRNFNRFRKTFVVSIVSDYYGVLQDRDGVTNAENNYKMVLDSQKRLEMEAETGRKPWFQVDQAQQNVLSARDGVVRAQQRYKQSLDEFKIRLALPTDADVVLDQNELDALMEIGISDPEFSIADSMETALLNRLDLANSADRIDDRLREVILAAEGLGPQLNITANAFADSDIQDTDFSDIHFQDGLYSLGLNADLPLDRKFQRNAYVGALIDLERQQRNYDLDIDRVKLNVRQSYRELQSSAQQYEIQKNSLELAERRVESTNLLLEAQRANARDLLEAQDDLLDAQNNLTSSLVNYTIAKLSFFRDVGILQVRPDGMWID